MSLAKIISHITISLSLANINSSRIATFNIKTKFKFLKQK